MITNKSQLEQTFQKLATCQVIEKQNQRNIKGGGGEPPPFPDEPIGGGDS
jgi:hypothetical protein